MTADSGLNRGGGGTSLARYQPSELGAATGCGLPGKPKENTVFGEHLVRSASIG